MAEPKEVTNEAPELYGVDGRRVKGSGKSDREKYLQKQNARLKEQLNASHDKAQGLKETFQRKMDAMKETNDKLHKDMQEIVAKHDGRLMKYMELSDAYDELEEDRDRLKREVAELRGEELPEQDRAPDQEGREDGAAEVLEEGES